MYAVGFLALVVAFILFIDIDILPLFSYATFQRVFARKSEIFRQSAPKNICNVNNILNHYLDSIGSEISLSIVYIHTHTQTA